MINSSDNVITGDVMKRTLDYLRAQRRYIYAILRIADIEDFYICRITSGEDGEMMTVMSLDDFVGIEDCAEAEGQYTICFDMRSEHVRRYDDPDNVNIIQLENECDVAPKELDLLFDSYIEFFCEKMARRGLLFRMRPEMKASMGLTDSDYNLLDRRAEACNIRAVNIIQGEYDALKNLPFIKK